MPKLPKRNAGIILEKDRSYDHSYIQELGLTPQQIARSIDLDVRTVERFLDDNSCVQSRNRIDIIHYINSKSPNADLRVTTGEEEKILLRIKRLNERNKTIVFGLVNHLISDLLADQGHDQSKV